MASAPRIGRDEIWHSHALRRGAAVRRCLARNRRRPDMPLARRCTRRWRRTAASLGAVLTASTQTHGAPLARVWHTVVAKTRCSVDRSARGSAANVDRIFVDDHTPSAPVWRARERSIGAGVCGSQLSSLTLLRSVSVFQRISFSAFRTASCALAVSSQIPLAMLHRTLGESWSSWRALLRQRRY